MIAKSLIVPLARFLYLECGALGKLSALATLLTGSQVCLFDTAFSRSNTNMKQKDEFVLHQGPSWTLLRSERWTLKSW